MSDNERRSMSSLETKISPKESQNYEHDLVVIPENDPGHPLNWPFRKKILHTVLYGMTTFCAQFSATILTGNVMQMAAEFHVGREVAILAYSIFLLGNMPGPVFFAPTSELLGRKVGIMIPMFISGCLIMITANLTSIWAVMVLRFFSGVFGAAPLVNAGGAMTDMWETKMRVAPLVLYAVTIVTGSTLGPIVSVACSTTGTYGWRWSCWIAGILCVIVSVLNWAALSESYVPVLESYRAKDIRTEKGTWAAHAKIDELTINLKELVDVHFSRPLMLLATPIVLAITLYSSFVYGILFLLVGALPELFVKIHGLTPVQGTLPVLSFLVGFLIGGVCNIINSLRYLKIAKRIKALPAPEEFLGAIMVLGWVMPAGCFIYGWTTYPDIHWMASTVGIGVIGWGFAVIFQSCIIYLLSAYQKYSASALAANTLVRSALAGTFPLFGTQMYDKLNPRWASSLLGFMCLAAVPIPWVFYRYGARLRKVNPFKKYMP